jgi:hypothetical protein
LRLTLHRKLFAANPSPQRLSELTQKSIGFQYKNLMQTFWDFQNAAKSLRLTLHRKLFATNPSLQQLSESTQKSIGFRYKI